MDTLTVIYDPDCGLCALVKERLGQEPAFLRLEFIPYRSAAATARFPGLCSGAKPELIVVDDAGGVYRDAKAYLMCLYALKRYRELAQRLASPVLLPLARQAFAALGHGRLALSRLMGLKSENELARELAQRYALACASDGGPATAVLAESRRRRSAIGGERPSA